MFIIRHINSLHDDCRLVISRVLEQADAVYVRGRLFGLVDRVCLSSTRLITRRQSSWSELMWRMMNMFGTSLL